ncbi:MAG: metal-dependent hydrolase [Pseudodesulfovibrio sp.]|uniref:Membrane-bound metal-dependent hydrolase n=1 Tax=Pseudodesulfovibrio aespoeensis (strain ATCC 700646 / DSM 10631 / Aspo-2) TaxID=643562 RepID=E6VZU6_PSEA9|nr:MULTISPECIES: metal-dependent hydrolase [Pseudodesulfovibrio]MBU4245131.1 metal-dependent hydrolase [Pseudomonadota bacterium]ADU62924.1 membrane-bound metal-dependent hydrolase [Pseudodesulfovibrio aespoeensis Aspo-2]MBU4380535.1 metal-dependent hydrolase [Pseudomonadota bacterium]MBU4474256.1 metal-dependent hydrolase [Pseudomonadota bacterium]MBU4514646.1 metal-dependent hydrolase [Pseudomonadota bacterium]
MDPVTHISSGVMGALAARRWLPGARYLVPFAMLCAWIPDADIFFGDGDPEFDLLHHRGITTSFFGGLVMALALAAIYRRISRNTSFAAAAFFAYAMILTHIWLDLITTYGTQILAPFSTHRFALDGAFIIDPLFTLMALALIGLAIVMKKSRHAIALAGMVWFFAYPLANMAAGAYLEGVYARQLTASGVDFDEVHVTPDALSPRYWKVVTTLDQDYLLDTMDLLGGAVEPPRRYRRADTGELETLGGQESMFATYAWFAKWPYVTREASPDPAGTAVAFGDLRFASTNPVLARHFGGRRQPFVLTAFVDEAGRLKRWSFAKGASSFDESLEH